MALASATALTGEFQIDHHFEPAGDQPQAIEKLTAGLLEHGYTHQTLMGVTGSGKTFAMAGVVEQVQRPTLVIAHNKTLAAQLATEFQEYFPHNSVQYFVSYYDYYQPEAYIPRSDTYIEKETDINEEIDRLRHAATRALMTRRDVLIVASVSCIYGMGSPQEYNQIVMTLKVGEEPGLERVKRRLIAMYYERNDIDFRRGRYRVKGDVLDIVPADDEEIAVRVEFFGDEIESIRRIDRLTGEILSDLKELDIYPGKHFITPEEERGEALKEIEEELAEQLEFLRRRGDHLFAERLEQRTNYDLEMLREAGTCAGIENYSQPLGRRPKGSAPWTLLDYFPEDYLLFIDECHMTIPQISGMFHGDRARKDTLVAHGFRLPSARDNRPLTFSEFEERVNQVIYVSATPGEAPPDYDSLDDGKSIFIELTEFPETEAAPPDKTPSIPTVLHVKSGEETTIEGQTVFPGMVDGQLIETRLTEDQPADTSHAGATSDNAIATVLATGHTPDDDVASIPVVLHVAQDEETTIEGQTVHPGSGDGSFANSSNGSETASQRRARLSTYAAEHEQQRVEMIIRPTGLVDPEIEVVPVEGQIDDLHARILETVGRRQRVLVTTLTKRMAEDLTDYLRELGVRVQYLHSEIDTLQRSEILRDLRLGVYDVLVGINLLREGIDLPEVSLVAILDADKEGFLRSGTSLIQTIGRAARHVDGKVVMYCDTMTDSLRHAIGETNRRREIQMAHNEQHGIVPQSIEKEVHDITERVSGDDELLMVAEDSPEYGTAAEDLPKDELLAIVKDLEKQMKRAATELEFELAASLRDQVVDLRKLMATRGWEMPPENRRRRQARGVAVV